MKKRNRIYISQIRKKFDRIEQLRKSGLIRQENDEAKQLVRELMLEVSNINEEIDNLLDTRSEQEKWQEKLYIPNDVVIDTSSNVLRKQFDDVSIKVNGKIILIGNLVVEIEIYHALNVRIKNISNPRKASPHDEHDFAHPHVNYGGFPCFGSIKDTLQASWKSGDVGLTFDLIKDYLHTYNPGSTYIKISRWDDSASYCEECGYVQVDCDCFLL